MSEWLQNLLDDDEAFEREVAKLNQEIQESQVQLAGELRSDDDDGSPRVFPWEFLTNSGTFPKFASTGLYQNPSMI